MRPPDDRPGTFDLLGFTHYWARSRNGYWVVKLKTATDRFSRAVRSIDHWCRDNRHLPIREQHQKLNQKLRGHYAYYGVTGNSAALSRFLHEVGPRWRQWLNSPQPPPLADLGEISCHPPSLPACSRSHGPLDSQTRSESMMRGTVCSSAGTYGSVGAPGR